MAQLVFIADDGSNGRELWITDGTAAGTLLLADLWPGGGAGNPSMPTPLGDGRAVFTATDPAHGSELWITDGTTAGTQLVLDINPAQSGFSGSNPYNFAAFGNGRVLFTANDPVHGSEPWVTDGTAAGTQVLEMAPGLTSSYVSTAFLPLGNGRALFGGSSDGNGQGAELWVTDGTPTGTHLVKDINPDSNGSYPGSASGAPGMVALGDGHALFSADDGSRGRELWTSDGTADGTYLLADLWPGSNTPNPGSGDYPNSSNPTNFAALGQGRILFAASDPEHGNELWISDGTADGTHLVADIWAGGSVPYSGASFTANSSGPSNILPLGNGSALFSADDGVHGRELWITDGTAAGTSLLADIWPGGGTSNPGESTSYYYSRYQPYGPPSGPGGKLALGDGHALFSATDPVHGTELWISDGTAAGTRLLQDINHATQDYASSMPSYFAMLGKGQVVFTADNGVNGAEPWITDGTSAGTHLLSNIYPGATGSLASGYVAISPAAADGEKPGASTTTETPPESVQPSDAWFVG
jgi:ELWxxDGT repeat protein